MVTLEETPYDVLEQNLIICQNSIKQAQAYAQMIAKEMRQRKRDES